MNLQERAVTEAAYVLSQVTGIPQNTWHHILKWRVRYYKGKLSKALKARTQEGEVVFQWPDHFLDIP